MLQSDIIRASEKRVARRNRGCAESERAAEPSLHVHAHVPFLHYSMLTRGTQRSAGQPPSLPTQRKLRQPPPPCTVASSMLRVRGESPPKCLLISAHAARTYVKRGQDAKEMGGATHRCSCSAIRAKLTLIRDRRDRSDPPPRRSWDAALPQSG